MDNPLEFGFGPLVATCRRFGISRTKAFRLVQMGLLDTFTMGRCRFVMLQSLLSLPERLASFYAENPELSP